MRSFTLPDLVCYGMGFASAAVGWGLHHFGVSLELAASISLNVALFGMAFFFHEQWHVSEKPAFSDAATGQTDRND